MAINWMSVLVCYGDVPFDGVGAAKTLPSGCHATFEEVSDSTSTVGMTPSIFLSNVASSDVIEKT